MNADFFSTSNLLKLCIRICLGILALVLVVEIVLWLFFRATVNPVMTIHLRNKIPGMKEQVTLAVNSDEQMRSLNWTTGQKAPGSVRILCVGGNATLGQFQNAEDTWWGQLAKMLEEKVPGTKIEIGANGAGGMLALTGAKWVGSFVQDWQPDIIITNLGAGDVLTQPFEYRYDAKLYDRLPSFKRERSGVKELLLKVSQLARRSRASNAKSDAARLEYQIGAENYFTDNYDKIRTEYAKLQTIPNPFRLSDADPRSEYLDGLKKLADQAEAVGATLILTGEACVCKELMDDATARLRCTLMPASPGAQNKVVKVSSEWVVREIRRFHESTETLAAEKKLAFLDLNEIVPQDPEHFVTETILTDRGASVVAEKILPKVLPVVQKIVGK